MSQGVAKLYCLPKTAWPPTYELWYIHADAPVRAARLKESRGYSEEKIRQIFESQLSETEFRAHCSVVIENNGDLQETRRQLETALCRDTAGL